MQFGMCILFRESLNLFAVAESLINRFNVRNSIESIPRKFHSKFKNCTLISGNLNLADRTLK